MVEEESERVDVVNGDGDGKKTCEKQPELRDRTRKTARVL